MSVTDESFLTRWSRLKRGDTAKPPLADPPAPIAPPAMADPVPPAETETPAAGQTVPQPPPPDLPPVDSLDAESDFTPFLRADVPEDLHRQALRKLWASDPIYANDDGLKDYAEDYTGLFTGTGAVRTLYRIGTGFLDTAPPEAATTDRAAGTAETDRAAGTTETDRAAGTAEGTAGTTDRTATTAAPGNNLEEHAPDGTTAPDDGTDMRNSA